MADESADETVEVSPDDLNAFARAKMAPSVEAVENLSKSEALYWLLSDFGLETPEGHPDDHNGNVTKNNVRALARARAEERYSDGEDE